MTVRALDESGDIVTRERGFITGREEIAQTIRTRLRLFLGEYFRNVRDGTPWFEQILGKFSSLDTVEAVLRARIVNTPGVIRLSYFRTNFELENRRYGVSGAVITDEGEVEFEFTGIMEDVI